ncbi:hypothetical protein [Thiothrix fructosivorans]|uniref:Uncharacterized protein n=1 Tax=Thiothrix fructosivorans TaxID=111770 RepID=A0A8B0SJT2_9GAMM|nr:hypothetical protein [Thiothrix fructosivorans]MBO0612953.1 hypothetical protein [Thiothrix fructosivorans]QTX11596.1 hypothetical protein J1836_004385 [Thiothrix fructosivorans]
MGTRARIKLVNDGKVIAATYIHMDGFVSKFAPNLILALQSVTPADILNVKRLFQMFALVGLYDGGGDENMNYLCEVDISQNQYKITIHGFQQKLLFQGTLEEFARCYDELD